VVYEARRTTQNNIVALFLLFHNRALTSASIEQTVGCNTSSLLCLLFTLE